ncbi:MAG: prolyl oligopeptidase family serine peptidase [Ilumatobacteraceae bacterium]
MDILPYGSWPSPIAPEMLTDGAIGLVDVWVEGDVTVWLESRPAEGGRLQLVASGPDGAWDVLPAGFSARSGVHEYGGGAAHVERGIVWFVNWDDQRIYRLTLDGATDPIAITPAPVHPRGSRFADITISSDGERLVCVRETHSASDPHDVRNELVLMDAARASEPMVLHGSSDFVMSPAFVGTDRVRFIAWDHPAMPWNDTVLMECRIDPAAGRATACGAVAGGASYMQPRRDLVISDRSGWWNLWRVGTEEEHPVTAFDAEIGGPAWVFGMRSYAILDDGRVVWSIGATVYVHDDNNTVDDTTVDAAALDQFAVDGTTVVAIAHHLDRDAEIVRFDVEDPRTMTVVTGGRHLDLAPDDISRPVPISYPTAGGAIAHGWFYAPSNAAVTGPDDERPPLVTMIHGGPTSRALPWFSLARQYWTSRGFAVVDVDHRGSTGFGTTFRDLLDGNWGVVDVEDCAAAATWLANEGLVDRSRMVIRGGSAGGFTVLACLSTTDVFAAGASLYGVADLTALAADTHKFESRYLDRLVGPWPDARAVYERRSPINHLDRFDRPLIVFQGLDDRVVPPAQSEMIVDALHAAGVTCEYHPYAGEGHGFRLAETIVHQLVHEVGFYRRVLELD